MNDLLGEFKEPGSVDKQVHILRVEIQFNVPT